MFYYFMPISLIFASVDIVQLNFFLTLIYLVAEKFSLIVKPTDLSCI